MIVYDNKFVQGQLSKFMAGESKVVLDLNECADGLMTVGVLGTHRLITERLLAIYYHIVVTEIEIASLWSNQNVLTHYELYTLGIESESLERHDGLKQLSMRRSMLKVNAEEYMLKMGVKTSHIQGYIDGCLSVSDVVDCIEAESRQERRGDPSDAINHRLLRWQVLGVLTAVVSVLLGVFVLDITEITWYGWLTAIAFIWLIWERSRQPDSSNTGTKKTATSRGKRLERVIEKPVYIYKNGSTLMRHSDGSYDVVVDDTGDNMVDDEIRYNQNDNAHLVSKESNCGNKK